MAITNNGTVNSLTNNELPAGYAKPVVTTFEDYEYLSTLNLTVLKATVENVDPAVTMANIIADVVIGITKQVDDILAADYLATATVTAYAEILALSNNFAAINGAGDYLKNIAASYTLRVKLYVKTV